MTRDTLEIVFHFVCSALVGALVACILLFVWGFPTYGGWIILGAALAFGIAGAVLGDGFWEADRNPLRWLNWWW
jgi:hypothetical protein